MVAHGPLEARVGVQIPVPQPESDHESRRLYSDKAGREARGVSL